MSDDSEASKAPTEDLERWITAGLSAASFTGLIQLSSLTPSPVAWSRQWVAALSFSIALVIALFGLFIALAAKGRVVQKELPAYWATRLTDLAVTCMSGAGLGIAIGAGFVSSHLLDPTGKWYGWPFWIYGCGFLALAVTLVALSRAEARERKRKQLGL